MLLNAFPLYLSLFILTRSLQSDVLPYRRGNLIPVLHNLDPDLQSARLVYEALPQRITTCTVSIRHDKAFEGLSALHMVKGEMSGYRKHPLTLGASTICSEEQVKQAKDCGAQFISTMFYSQRIIEVAAAHNIPVLGGVMNQFEARKSYSAGIDSLKFYPASIVTPSALGDILLDLSVAAHGRNIIVAGGLAETEVITYLRAGATGFAVGIDCRKHKESPETITKILNSMLDVIDNFKFTQQSVSR